MPRTEEQNRFATKAEGLVNRLREKADELVTTPPTIADPGLLPHVLKELAVVDQVRSGRLDPFAKCVQANQKLAETRLIALAAVQNLLAQVQSSLASLEFTCILQCADLLRWFDALMTLVTPNLRVSDAFQDLESQVDDVKALFVAKASAMLQSVVARASANEPRTPWRDLLRYLGDVEHLLSINPMLFESAQGIQSLLDRVETVFCPPPAEASARRAVQPLHVNQVVWDLYSNSRAPYLATTASSVFGGVCSNNFLLAPPPTLERTWMNAPLPRTPHKRAIALNWITTYLHEQTNLLRAQCQVDLGPQNSTDVKWLDDTHFPEKEGVIPLPDGMSKSITVHSLSDDKYFQEKHSVIHLVHLPRLETHHLTEYREHVVHLPIATVVQWRKNRLYAKEAKCPPWEKVDNMSLSYMGSSYGVKTKGLTNHYVLTREFDGDAEYCEIATSITADDGNWRPNLDGLKREWTNWVIVTKLDESTTSVVQMSVSLGLQYSQCKFVRYDNLVWEEDCADPSAAFEGLARRLKQECAEAFEKDAKRCIKGLQEVMSCPLVNLDPPVASENDDYVQSSERERECDVEAEDEDAKRLRWEIQREDDHRRALEILRGTSGDAAMYIF